MNTLDRHVLMFSVERVGNSQWLNDSLNDSAKRVMVSHGIEFHNAIGAYKGIKENSYAVILPLFQSADYPKHRDKIIELARNAEQESILTIDSNGMAYLSC